MIRPLTDPGIKTFLTIWCGQLISALGSGLTAFALGAWVYQRTGSVTAFASLILAGTLPGILISPLAGMFVDRWNRRLTAIFCDSGSALGALAIALLLFAERFDLRYLCLILVVKSICATFKGIAFSAMITMLIPRQHFGRVSGLMQMGPATARIISPMVAGILLAVIHIQGVVLIDAATFLFPVVAMLVVRIPQPKATAEGNAAGKSWWREISYGWVFIRTRPGVFGLLIFFAIMSFVMGLAYALFRPLLLSFTSIQVVGIISTIGGAGLLIGSIVMSLWGGPKDRVRGILGVAFLYGVGLMLTGLRPSVPLIAGTFFCVVLGVPILHGCIQMIWQSKTPPDVQGRVFAVGAMITQSSLPLAYLVAGPLADKVFEPLLTVGGPLAGTVGRIIGTGPGRGVGLLYIVIGIFTLLVATGGYLYPHLRLMDDEVPDVVVGQVPAKMEHVFT